MLRPLYYYSKINTWPVPYRRLLISQNTPYQPNHTKTFSADIHILGVNLWLVPFRS